MKVMALIGSSKQKEDFIKCYTHYTLEGYCVLGLGIYLGSEDHGQEYNEVTPLKEALRLSHRKRIEVADIVGVIRKPDGGVGADTLDEIIFAFNNNKEVRYIDYVLLGEKE